MLRPSEFSGTGTIKGRVAIRSPNRWLGASGSRSCATWQGGASLTSRIAGRHWKMH